MPRRLPLALALALLAPWAVDPASADDFDQLDGAALESIVKDREAKPREALTVSEIGGLRSLLRGSRSALLIATTDQGNPCRLLVSAGLRKPPGGQGEPVPVLVLERFDTFESGNLKHRLARGRELLLFDGFLVDLDSGQVVPDGQGGDLQFQVGIKEKEHGRLAAVAGAKLIAPTRLPAPTVGPAGRPSPGRAILPGDFAGRYRLFANGQWSGTLNLKVEAKSVVSGQFQSDQTGNAYAVNGQVAINPTNQIHFVVEYPRARQEFDGLMFVENKGAIAGTVTLLERPFGFFALREGGTFAPDGEDLGPSSENADQPGRKVITVEGAGSYALDGQRMDDAALTEALKAAVAAEPTTSILLRVGGAIPFSVLDHAIDDARSAGVASIRLAPVAASSPPRR